MMTSNVSNVKWEPHRDEIYTLLLEQQMNLDTIMQHMKQKGLVYSKHQWTAQLKKWGFDKNIDEEEWERINHHHEHWKKRKQSKMAGESGEDLVVALAGVRKSEKQIQKGISRHCRPTFKRPRYELLPISPARKQSSLVIYLSSHTPWPKNLPWFCFHDQLLQAIGDNHIEQLQQTSTPILQPFIQSLSKNPLLKSVFVSIAGEPLLERQDPAHIHYLLSCFMPERHTDENLTRTTSICHRGAQFALTTSIEILLFAYSNNLEYTFTYRSRIDVEEDLRFLAIVESLLTIKPLVAMLKASQTTPTAQALIDRVFASAVRQQRLDVLRALVSLGFNITSRVNKRITYSHVRNEKCLPVNFALLKGDQDLVETLLEQGATFTSYSKNNSESSLYFAVASLERDNTSFLLEKVFTSQIKISEVEIIHILNPLCLQKENMDIGRLILNRFLGLTPPAQLKKPLYMLALAIRWEEIKIVENLMPRIEDLDAVCMGIISEFCYNTEDAQITNTTAIIEAARSGSLEICEKLLNAGAKPDPLSEGISALCIAAYHGHLEIVSLLCARGADINRKGWFPTALSISVEKKQIRITEQLLVLGVKPSADDLVTVVRCRNIELARLFLPIVRKIPYKALMATAAADAGDMKMVDLFSEFGAKWHRRNRWGNSPLVTAIMLGHNTLVSRLLETRPCRYDPAALLAATYAAAQYDTEISTFHTLLNERRSSPSELLVELLEGITLITAVFFGHEATLVPLLKSGFTVPQRFPNSRETMFDMFVWERKRLFLTTIHSNKFRQHFPLLSHGMTILGAAALSRKRDRMVRFLLKRGYRPNAKDILGAAEEVTQPIMECLCDALPPNLDRIYLEAKSLPIFIGHGWISLVEALLIKGIDVNIGMASPYRDEPIMTPLQAATWSGNLELVRKLIEYGARVNEPASSDRGATALQFAALRGSIGLVKLLIENRANCNALGAEFQGRTALEGAAEHGHLDVLSYLLLNGAETEGDHRMAYVRAVKRAELECHYAAANLLRGCRAWTEEDEQVYLEDLLREKYYPDYRRHSNTDLEEEWELFSDEESIVSNDKSITSKEGGAHQRDLKINLEGNGEISSDEEEVRDQAVEAEVHKQHEQDNCEQNTQRSNMPNSEEFLSADMYSLEGIHLPENVSGLESFVAWDDPPAVEHTQDAVFWETPQDYFPDDYIPEFDPGNEGLDDMGLEDAAQVLGHASPAEGAQPVETGTTKWQDFILEDTEDWRNFLNDL